MSEETKARKSRAEEKSANDRKTERYLYIYIFKLGKHDTPAPSIIDGHISSRDCCVAQHVWPARLDETAAQTSR